MLELVDRQGHLSNGANIDGIFLCDIFIDHTKENFPKNSITYI